MVRERPVIVAVDDQVTQREQLRLELEHRYDRDYDIVTADSPTAALLAIQAALVAGQRVAVVLASQWMAELDGTEVLARARSLTPRTKRCLLIALEDWGRQATAIAIQNAIASGSIDTSYPSLGGHPLRSSIAPSLRSSRSGQPLSCTTQPHRGRSPTAPRLTKMSCSMWSSLGRVRLGLPQPSTPRPRVFRRSLLSVTR
jgi:CheY-like chemotaxis protein